MDEPLVIALSENGMALAQEIAALPGISQNFSDKTSAKDLLRRAFRLGRPIIAVGASAIVIRILAPLLKNKSSEPPVLCVSPMRAVIVLLGGHHGGYGGGNGLARRIAEHIGGEAVISTAGELGEPLENPPMGWRVSGDAKAVLAKSLRETVTLYDPYGVNYLPHDLVNESATSEGAHIVMSDGVAAMAGAGYCLHPPMLALGVGCERDVPADIIIAEVSALLAAEGLCKESVACVATIDLKSDEGALWGLAESLGVGLRFFSAEELRNYDARLVSPSDIVLAEVGCRGVAEGAALAAFGGHGDFVVAKRKFSRFTCAIVRSRVPLMEVRGSRVGRLDIVGIGPGASSYRTDSGVLALRDADVVVGYSLYLDLCLDIIGDKERLSYGLGEESARCLKALELASSGKNVALVCSGDAGIYGLGSVVYDVLAECGDRILRSVEICLHPGVSAFQLLSARCGALMGDDFCLISLSDLWVSEAIIRRRVCAAVLGDFAIAFYNPRSLRRRELLPYAMDVVARRRGLDVPVVLGRNLGRAEETVRVMRLRDFDVSEVDMLSLVMVGNSRTRFVSLRGEERVYSPRIMSEKALRDRHKAGD